MSGMAMSPRRQRRAPEGPEVGCRATGGARAAVVLLVAALVVGACSGSSGSSGDGSLSRDGGPGAGRVRATPTTPDTVATTTTGALPGSTGTTATTAPPATTAPRLAPARVPAGTDAVVEKHVDGDTIVVSGGRKVRLIGIDTPETKDPRKPVQCFGREAALVTASLVPVGERVRLVADVEPFDRYGRTLAYVYRLRDGLFVNAELVRLGYASVYTYPPNVAHAEEFVALGRRAREAGAGLWGACGGPGVPAGTPAGSGGGGTGGGGGSCSPAYPTVCIPPPPPDLDCGEVAARRFRVVAPDPHRFDRDGDGVGCES